MTNTEDVADKQAQKKKKKKKKGGGGGGGGARDHQLCAKDILLAKSQCTRIIKIYQN